MNNMEDSFIDTCIIISGFDSKDKYYETINIFLDGPEKIIISVYQEHEEIPNLFSRKQKLFTEAIKFYKNPLHPVDYSTLTDKEKILLKTLLTKIHLKQENEDSLNQMLEEVIDLKIKVFHFIQKRVYRKVVPILEIKEELVNLIKKHNQNKADAKIIASAIQEHQKNKLIAFTLDKNDWKINSIKEKIQELNYDCPEVRFLR